MVEVISEAEEEAEEILTILIIFQNKFDVAEKTQLKIYLILSGLQRKILKTIIILQVILKIKLMYRKKDMTYISVSGAIF